MKALKTFVKPFEGPQRRVKIKFKLFFFFAGIGARKVNNTFHAKMESIQYNTCLAITGGIRGTSREKIYEELGLKSLQLRRWYGKLCLFYKVFKNEHPKYLFSKIIFFHLLLLNGITETPILETRRVIQSLREKYLISYDLPQILFLIATILKELNLLQDLDLV